MKFYDELDSIHEKIEDIIEKEQSTWYPNRQLSSNDLIDLEEVFNLLGKIINSEPTDQEMMSSFGTKWHDKL